MSGGAFEYSQYRMQDIIDTIQSVIENNDKEDDYGSMYGFSKETLDKFKTGIKYLKLAQIYAQRIDWLISGDDGEESFHKRLKDNLEKAGLGI